MFCQPLELKHWRIARIWICRGEGKSIWCFGSSDSAHHLPRSRSLSRIQTLTLPWDTVMHTVLEVNCPQVKKMPSHRTQSPLISNDDTETHFHAWWHFLTSKWWGHMAKIHDLLIICGSDSLRFIFVIWDKDCRIWRNGQWFKGACCSAKDQSLVPSSKSPVISTAEDPVPFSGLQRHQH